MTDLWLKFDNPLGGDERVKVDKESFTVGRHSTADLSIADGKLSREHIRIEKSGLDFLVSDCGSSNGTTLNGKALSGTPVALKNGDLLVLGGGVQITIDDGSVEETAEEFAAMPAEDPEAGETPVMDGSPEGAAGMPEPAPAGGIPMMAFIIAPILGIVILVFVGILIFLFSTGSSGPAKNDDFVYTTNKEIDTDSPANKKSSDNTADDTPTGNSTTEPPSNDSTSPQNSGETNAAPTPKNLSDTGKSETNAASFLRRIAQNDPKAFLTGEQAQVVSAKVKQLSSSSALAENISSARKNANQISTLATSKNLKPQFLATAAITKLGNSRGDVLQTAQGMAETFEKLGTQIGSELANDSLLMIAAYDQGAAGDFMKMRNMLQDIATKFPESSRAIRTIWFLHKQGKITDGEYDFAVRFLAIGTITQNPKDFGVNTDALVL